MPKSSVLVRLAESSARASAAAALEARFAVTAEDPAVCPGTPLSWIAARYQAVVLDYDSRDAASVKLLQAATEREGALRFLFVLPPGEELDKNQFLMAINEGAWAILASPLDDQALATYVDRAVNGPGRFRRDWADCDRKRRGDTDVAALEAAHRRLRADYVAAQRLVSKLLSTPSSQWRRQALLASDSEFQREQLGNLMSEHGWQVRSVSTVQEAIDTALSFKPRVVVSDLELPDSDGVNLCRELKLVHKFVPCYFVICTTAGPEKMAQVLEPGNGVDDCVAKPTALSGQLDFITRISLGLLIDG